MKRSIIFIVLAIVFLLTLVSYVLFSSSIFKNIEIKSTEEVTKDKIKYSFEKSPFYNEYYNIDDRIIVLNLWATWCEPCIKEMPMLNELQSKFKAKNIDFVSLSIDKDSSKVARFINSKKFNFIDITQENLNFRDRILNNLDYKVEKDIDKTFSISISSTEIPVTYIFKNKKLIATFKGTLDAAKFEKTLYELQNMQK